MKIAIHDQGACWTPRWIEYCRENNLDYTLVDGYSTNIIEELASYDVFLWHINNGLFTDLLMARNVLFTAESMGLKVFPNFATSWHFDDKISQKYLLEGIKAPLAQSWTFYDLNRANTWLKNQASYPVVAKLRRGSGSYNVQLLHDYHQAIRHCKRMFGKGIHPTPAYLADVSNKLKVAGNLRGIIKRLKKAPNFFKWIRIGKRGFPVEKSYVYFQEFLPNNKWDTRISVVGERAFGFRRFTREGDFRASGSGMIDFDPSPIDLRCVEIAFQVAQSLQTQSLAFDFVSDASKNPKIVEISFGFLSEAILKCPGYWRRDLAFTNGAQRVEDLILQDLIASRGFETRPVRSLVQPYKAV
jgi:glutathione synthase/RimK-type ligase-like ATP-grasp enzyme